jgi:hypothetical protein
LPTSMKHHPAVPVVLDAKRGDIGATAQQYAREAFERYAADALTVNPYMGFDSVEPYLEFSDRGLIVLCRTSNPGGSDLQNLKVEGGRKLYQHVAELVAGKWNVHGQNALVVGATFPEELADVRAIVGDLPLLVPGIGAQGGDVEATVKAGRTVIRGRADDLFVPRHSCTPALARTSPQRPAPWRWRPVKRSICTDPEQSAGGPAAQKAGHAALPQRRMEALSQHGAVRPDCDGHFFRRMTRNFASRQCFQGRPWSD